jgi:SAM-dependent methyltransferase
MDVTILRDRLAEISRITDAEWLGSLDTRKRTELEFHDRDRDRAKIQELKDHDQDTYERFYGNKKYYDVTQDSKNYVDGWIEKHAPGKVFLDYACGNGDGAIKAAKAGAALAIGIDISSVSVRNAADDAAAKGVAHNSQFVPDGSVDYVLCRGMLHHLDLSYSFPELRRILAPGGKILAVEALDYNPLIKLYRKMTPAMRTEWETAHILGLKDLRFAERFFDLGDVKYWHITSIVGPHMRPLISALNGLDRLLTSLPLVKLLAWIFTFELKSKRAAK